MKREELRRQNSSLAVARIFKKLISCLPADFGAALLDMNRLCDRVYVVSSLNDDARHPLPSEVPWPLVVATTLYSRKYIWSSNKFSHSTVIDHLIKFENKMLWQYTLRKQSLQNPTCIQRIRKRLGLASKCKSAMPAELMAVCGELRSIVGKAVARSFHAKFDDHLYFVKMVRWIKAKMCVQILETDKDGGFAIVPTELFDTCEAADFIWW